MAEIIAETERLRLRNWDADDLDEFMRHTNTPAVMRWLGGVWDRDKHEAAFDRIKSYERDYGHTFWLVERKSDGALLGFCGLKRVNNEGAPNPGDFEVGWRLREDAWGQGYAKEAATASLAAAFDRFGADEVVALTVPGNTPSWGLMKRLGMRRREELDYIDPRFGEDLNPSIIYSIDRETWENAK